VSQSGFSLGSINFQLSKTRFTDYAVYGQATYAITPQLKLTAGMRYTWDKQVADIRIQRISAATQLSVCSNPTAPGYNGGATFPASERFTRCNQRLEQPSAAPTWTIGLDYTPIEDVMVYAKYSRGYRAGGLSLFGPDSASGSTVNLQKYRPEKVDAFEVGAKTSWRGAVPGSFNVAAYYNNFTDQQLLLGVVIGSSPNATVANAGKSRLAGIDVDLMLRPFDGLTLNVGYAYLNTKHQQ
jgi:iron complex outermembrane receptor protein